MAARYSDVGQWEEMALRDGREFQHREMTAGMVVKDDGGR